MNSIADRQRSPAPDSRLSILSLLLTRLATLALIARPLLLLAGAIVLLSLTAIAAGRLVVGWGALGIAAVGLALLAASLWQFSGTLLELSSAPLALDGLVVGRPLRPAAPRVVAISGGAGLLILANLGEQMQQLTAIIPFQDQVDYYYRASSLFAFRNVYYVPPTPTPVQLCAEISNGKLVNVKGEVIVHNPRLAGQHVERLLLRGDDGAALADPEQLPVSMLALDAIREADVILLGPGGLFESVLPNLLLPQVRAAIQASKAPLIYVCNLMTEPGLTHGFSLADHIRAIKSHGGITPDYVLVNARRIDPETHAVYVAANYAPVFVDPEVYEETVVLTGAEGGVRQLLVEGVVVVEADLATSMVQLTASLETPGSSRAVRVLRHDPQKLWAAVLSLLER